MYRLLRSRMADGVVAGRRCLAARHASRRVVCRVQLWVVAGCSRLCEADINTPVGKPQERCRIPTGSVLGSGGF